MVNRDTRFLIKRSNVPGKIPTNGDLLLGELGLNTADAILYTSGTTANTILPIGWDRVARTGDTMTGGLFTPFLSATTVSATTYLNLPSSYFTGGTVSGTTNFISGLTANTIYTDYIDLNTNYTGATTQGRLSWDTGTGTLNIGVGDVGGTLIDLQVGQEEVVRVYNSESTPLLKGEIVYVYGSQGNRPSVKRAIATGDGYSVTTLGMVDVDIPAGSEGYVTTFGMINNLNTIGLTGGTAIWLSPTVAGGYTSTKPQAPYHTVLIGYVVRVSATVGSVFINISNGWEIDELHDVRINGKTFGDLLSLSAYNGTNVWVNTKTLNGSYTITGDTTVGGQLKANSISATTYYNLPTDIRVTGGTYSSGTATFTNNTGGTFTVTGFTTTGLTTTGVNVGGGVGIYSGFSGTSLVFKTLTSTATTINIINNSDSVNLETNAGVAVVPIATSNVPIGTASNDYYLNFKVPYNLIVKSVTFSVSIAGSDNVRFGIYRGQDLTAILVGQSAASGVSTINTFNITAESGQNLSFNAGEWMVIGVAVAGTTTNLYGSDCPANNAIAWTNTTDSGGGFPVNPRSKAGTRTSFPSVEINVV